MKPMMNRILAVNAYWNGRRGKGKEEGEDRSRERRGVGREKEEGEMEGRSPTSSSIREGSKQSF